MSTERRTFIETTLLTAAGTLISAATPLAFADSSKKHSAKSKTTATSSLQIQDPEVLKLLAVVHKAASDCSMKGEACHQHCQEKLVEGETDFTRCSISVQQMMVFSQATAKLSSLKSVRIADLLEGTLAAARTCQSACEEHKSHWEGGMHLECKACAESCAQLISACTSLKNQLKV